MSEAIRVKPLFEADNFKHPVRKFRPHVGPRVEDVLIRYKTEAIKNAQGVEIGRYATSVVRTVKGPGIKDRAATASSSVKRAKFVVYTRTDKALDYMAQPAPMGCDAPRRTLTIKPATMGDYSRPERTVSMSMGIRRSK